MMISLIFVLLAVSPSPAWELNYPVLAFLMNNGYYVDYASMMGLPAMHHTTWDSLVSWVGTHVERLAEWSCE